MTLTPITLEDIQALTALYTKTFSEAPWNEPWTEDISKKRLTQMIKCDGFVGMKIEDGNQLIGLILGNIEYSFRGTEFYIKEFCTDSDVQGKGVGTKLLASFEAHLKELGVNSIYLLTAKGGEIEAYYERRQYETDIDWILMRKTV